MKSTHILRALIPVLLSFLVVQSVFPANARIFNKQKDSIETSRPASWLVLPNDNTTEPVTVVNQTLEIDLDKTVNRTSSRNMSVENGSIYAKDANTEALAVSSTIKAPIAFTSLGIKWTASSGDSALGIAIRTSEDSINWSSWTNASIDEHLTDRFSKVFFSRLISVPRGIKYIQYSVRMAETQGVTASTSLSSLALALIDPGQTPPAVLEQLITDKPLMLSRTNWGCPEGEESLNLDEVITEVTHLIVHHTATSNTSSDWPASVRSIWSYHTIDRGWGDIGYNFLIDPLGTIYVGRAGGDNVRGAHFACQNSGTQGIAMIGDFTSVAPTTAALNSLDELLAWLASRENINPLAVSFHDGTQLDLSNIAGHRDGNPSTTACTTTACPGDTFYPMLADVRTNVEALIADAGGQAVQPQQSSIVLPFDVDDEPGSRCYGIIEINGEVLANIHSAEHGCTLHRLDSQGNHQLFSELDTTPMDAVAGKHPGFGLSPPFRGWYYFEGDNGLNGNGLWRTDGSSIEDMVSDDAWISDGIVLRRGIMNDRMYFSVQNSDDEYGVYSTDGITLRAEPELDADEESSANLIGSFFEKLLYAGSDAQHGSEPWIFDGSEYRLLEDIIPGSEGSDPNTFLGLNDYWFFAAKKPSSVDKGLKAFFKTDGTEVSEIPHSGEWRGPLDENYLQIKSGDTVYLVANLAPLPGGPQIGTPPPTPTPVMSVREASSVGYDLGNYEALTETASAAVLGDDALVLIANRLFRLAVDSGKEMTLELPSDWQGSDFEFVGAGTYYNHAYIKETGTDGNSRVWAWSENEALLLMAGESKAVTSADHFRHIGKDIFFYGEDELNGRALRKIPDSLSKPLPWLGAVTGSWYDPATSGQGFVLHVMDDKRTVVSFYTFEDDGTPLWLTGVGQHAFETGKTTEIELLATSGGNFGTFNPEQITNETWGTVKLTFQSCQKATAELNGQTGMQSMGMVRLAGVKGLECYKKTPPIPKSAGFTGSWYDPATSGQGFVLHAIDDEKLVVSFYGYKNNSERLWLVGVYEGGIGTGEPLVLDVIFATGGNFGAFTPEDITEVVWGTLTIDFEDCNNATATLDGIDGLQTMQLEKLAGLQGSELDCH